MVLVAERYARQGVGRRLMRHLVSAMGTTPLTLHATSSGRPLYEELGFKATGRAETVRGHFTAAGPESPIATRAATAEDLTGILRLDETVFGTDRTLLITRLPAFADQLRVAEEHGRIIGYAAAWPKMDTQVVGPLVAQDTETAQALLASLAARTDRPLRTDIDVRHEALLSWTKEHGLASSGYNTVMTYGTPELPGDWTRRFAPDGRGRLTPPDTQDAGSRPTASGTGVSFTPDLRQAPPRQPVRSCGPAPGRRHRRRSRRSTGRPAGPGRRPR